MNWGFRYSCIWIHRRIYKKNSEAAQHNQPEHVSALPFRHTVSIALGECWYCCVLGKSNELNKSSSLNHQPTKEFNKPSNCCSCGMLIHPLFLSFDCLLMPLNIPYLDDCVLGKVVISLLLYLLMLLYFLMLSEQAKARKL